MTIDPVGQAFQQLQLQEPPSCTDGSTAPNPVTFIRPQHRIPEIQKRETEI